MAGQDQPPEALRVSGDSRLSSDVGPKSHRPATDLLRGLDPSRGTDGTERVRTRPPSALAATLHALVHSFRGCLKCKEVQVGGGAHMPKEPKALALARK